MKPRKLIRGVLMVVLPLVVLAAGGAGFVTLVKARKPPPRKVRPHLGPLVQVVEARAAEVALTVTAHGTVRPEAEVDVVPQVSGEVVEMSPNLATGGFVREGEVLLRIDPRDYELRVRAARAEVERADHELHKTREEAAAAREEWRQVYGDAPPPGDDSLLFRGPQLRQAQAGLEAARARLAEAELALERTGIRAPFDARVRSESVDRGQYVAAGKAVARLYATRAVEVVFPVSTDELGWIEPPHPETGPRVVVEGRYGTDGRWEGRMVRAEGVVDEASRTVGLVARVVRPFAPGRPPLPVGLFVEGRIEGRRLRGVIPLPREALREGNLVWTVEGSGVLRFRPVEVARVEGDRVLVASGLEAGERVVVSRVDAASDGMAVRVAEATP
ncbi:MAG: efflux RND transporter periplasmic adaptor subunit [Deferrisomatales bacterium]